MKTVKILETRFFRGCWSFFLLTLRDSDGDDKLAQQIHFHEIASQ